MKTIIAVVFAVIAIGLGAFNVIQHRESSKLKNEAAVLREQLKALEAELAERAAADEKIAQAERKAKVLQETLKQSSEVAVEQSKQVARLQESLAAAKTNSGGGLAAILDNPEMREMIKTQQKAVLGPMIERSYGALFKQLNLTPEQTAQIKELLEKKLSIGTDMGLSMMDSSMTPEKRKELGEQIKTRTAEMDKALEEFLGSDSYKTFQSYEKTIPDRMQVSQYKEQLAGSDNALSTSQEDLLINLMSSERQNFKWTTDFNDPSAMAVGMDGMFTEDRIQRFMEEQGALNARVLEQAAAFLKPSQVTSLKSQLETQLKMQEMGMKIAREMFKGKSN